MSNSLRIAIADDEADIRRFYEKIVGRLGHEVIASVDNGRELVEQCCARPPDLIITDILMPEMNGIDAVRRIGSNHAIPVIIASSQDAHEHDDFSTCNHVVASLTKPIKGVQLATAVSEAADFDALPPAHEM